ncbi:MAG: phosphonate ABC transporter, permease protein PhnE [Pikeienuella sp.]
MTDIADLDRARRAEAIADAYAALERRRKIYSFLMIVIALAVLFSGLRVTEAANAGGFLEGLPQLFDYAADVISEAWEAGWAWFPLLWQYMPFLIETINMAVVATLIGFALAFVVSFIASRNLVKYGAIVWIARRLLDISRAFPEIVIALFLIFLIGKNPIAAVAAIAFHSVGALGKLFSEVNENIDMKPLDGLAASGASWTQRIWFGAVPQVMPNFLSYALLRLEINVRASAIMGFVGAGGLGQQFKTVTDLKHGDHMSAILVLLIGSIFLIDWISSRLRGRIIGDGGH